MDAEHLSRLFRAVRRSRRCRHVRAGTTRHAQCVAARDPSTISAAYHPSVRGDAERGVGQPRTCQRRRRAQTASVLYSVGRFWADQAGHDVLVEPDGWQTCVCDRGVDPQSEPAALVAGRRRAAGRQVLVPSPVGAAPARRRWNVFEASGADLQADQVYIGQLEGRIRQVVDELARGYRMIWYIPDIVQVAMSGRHQGQSATMLDQIVPAIAAGRLVVWGEATPKGIARLMQIKPSLRATVRDHHDRAVAGGRDIDPRRGACSTASPKNSNIRFVADSAKWRSTQRPNISAAADCRARRCLMLKLSAIRAKDGEEGDRSAANPGDAVAAFRPAGFDPRHQRNSLISNRCAIFLQPA